MKRNLYDFVTVPERRGKDALALDQIGRMPDAPEAPDAGFDPIPMWVADMNFRSFPRIQEEIIRRAQHPSFGYFNPREEYFSSIIEWHRCRHGAELSSDMISYHNGVLGGLVTALRAFSSEGDGILLHEPTYKGFIKSIEGAGRRPIYSKLMQDENGVWRMDFEDMDRKLRDHKIHLAVFCSPHNPTGRVWTREELTQLLELLARRRCLVICDEVWSDLVLRGQKHLPLSLISEDAKSRCISLYAASKSFNLAGFHAAYDLIYDEYLRDRMRAEAAKSHYNSMNILSMYAQIAAYSEEGAVWLDELREVLSENLDRGYRFFSQIEGVNVAKPEGTYMLLPDVSALEKRFSMSHRELVRAFWRLGVAVNDGLPFRFPCGVRMNFASPTARIDEALSRLKKYLLNR